MQHTIARPFDFRVFDFCFNFDFFGENPEGIEGSDGVSLRARLFRSRVRLLTHVQATPDLDPEAALAESLTTALHREVAAMNRENFIVRMQLEAVERFRKANHGSGSPHPTYRQRVVEIAMLLEEKSAIPVVAAQLAYLASVQESAFWEGIGLSGLEELRLRLRGLVPFLDKKTRTVVYTDFKDEITAVREDAAVYLPKMTGVEYEKKVQEYLKNHLDHIVIRRLRNNKRLTAADLRGLERTLVEIGEDDGRTLLTGVLARHDAPSLVHFVQQYGGDGPRRRAGGLLGFPLQPQHDHAADPFRRDGDRPAHGAGCHGAVRALRGAVQQSARRRSRRVVRRKEKRDRRDLREVGAPSPRTPGRGRLKAPVSWKVRDGPRVDTSNRPFPSARDWS